MQRSLSAVSAIKSLGYPGQTCVSRCDCDELPCPLISWLSAQLGVQCPELKILGSGEGGDLLLAGELNNLLSEMSSPLSNLTSEGLDTLILNKITDYFVSELQAAIIIKHKELEYEENTSGEESPKEQRIEASENPDELCQECEDDTDHKHKSATQSEWTMLLKTLNMDPNSQISDVLNEVELKLTNLPGDPLGRPLLHTTLSPEQWIKLEKINEFLSSDYQCRREMMIKRFQVTLESFAWGDKEKERSKVLKTIPPITSLVCTSKVSLPLVLAARMNQSCIEPIRSVKSTPVYQVRMGDVPDRGGRPGEIEPPMPAWKDHKAGHRSGRGGGSQKWRKFTDKKKKKH